MPVDLVPPNNEVPKGVQDAHCRIQRLIEFRDHALQFFTTEFNDFWQRPAEDINNELKAMDDAQIAQSITLFESSAALKKFLTDVGCQNLEPYTPNKPYAGLTPTGELRDDFAGAIGIRIKTE
jgi:hypothetical protein